MAKYNHANCFGYAVKQNKWLRMRSWRQFVEPQNESELMTREEAELEAVNELEFRFGLRFVHPSEMELGKEYIAYKFSMQDYHFMRRNKKGHWRHKQGQSEVSGIAERNVFKSKWKDGLFYNSRTLLFEVPECSETDV